MPDLKPEVSDPPAAGAAAVTAPGRGGDPLEKLYKMSTTAGLGSGEYVAINGTAIAAICLGAATALALLGELFLIVAVVAVVCAVLAIIQIRDSNGTQKGIGLAIAGILLALSFGGYVLAKRASGYVAEREDRAAIGRLIIEWGDAVKAGRTDELYARFSENFRQRIPRDRFDQVMKSMRSNQLYGELQSVESNNLVSFEEDPTTGRKVAVTAAKMRFDKLTGDETFRTVVQFRKLPGGDQWEFDNAPELFPASPQGGPNPAGAPQPPGGVPEGPALPD